MTLLVHYRVSWLYCRTNAISSIYPSVYVAYGNIRASDVCPSFGNGEFRRGGTYNTTIAYPPGILSTSICSEGNDFHQGFSTGNVTEQQNLASYNSTCLRVYAIGETKSGPYQSLSQDIIKLDPAWSSCTAALSGAFDSSIALQKTIHFEHIVPVKFPAIVLHKATALAPEPGKYSLPTPAPASPVAPPNAHATATAPPNDPGKPGVYPFATKADPETPEQQNPHTPGPVKSTANSPEPDFQGPDKQTPDQPDPEQPSAIKNNDDSASSATIPVPLNGGNVAQGNPEVISGPESNDLPTDGEISQGDLEANPETGHNAGSDLTPMGTYDQSPAENPQSLPSIGGHQIQAANGGGIVIASTTLQPGVQTVIDSTPISVGKDQIVVISSTIPLAPPSADPIITLINGDIISAGGTAAIVGGTTVALAPDGDALIINGKTSPLPPPSTPILTVAGQTFTAAPTGFAIGGQSVLPGGPAVTYAANVFSLSPDGNALIVNGRTTPLPPAPISVVTVGSQTFTPASTGFAIDGKSVLPGGSAVLVDGTLISLDHSSELIIGAKTVLLGSAAQTNAEALGGLILHGFGGGGRGGGGAGPTGGASPTGASSNGSQPLPFVGGGGRLRVGVKMVVFALFVSLGAGGVALEL